ncbi:MAG TPA: Hsp20/alpha crystallin family protein [Chloroflexia bacterium]|nr:Hsp20/alpha crystallin family protein [Chloroflexia bacterium]
MEYMNNSQQNATAGNYQPQGGQQVPLNVWQTESDLVVEAPLPGIMTENIEVEVRGNQLIIMASVTGSHGESKQYISQEWHLGPYQRLYELPCNVDINTANASFGSGVLVITLPKTAKMQSGRIRLERTGGAQGISLGHAGQSDDKSNATRAPHFENNA